MAPLTGATPESLAKEIFAHAAQWNFANLATQLATRPLLIITSDDGWSAPNDALVKAVEGLGSQKLKAIHFSTDHVYSDHRIALQQAVLDGLARLQQQ
jgi:hypothetical protein